MRFFADHDVYQCVYREQRLLITRDKGFGALVFLAHRQHSGVILLRIDPLTVDALHQELCRLIEEHTEIKLRNCFVVVEPGRHRIRISSSAASGD